MELQLLLLQNEAEVVRGEGRAATPFCLLTPRLNFIIDDTMIASSLFSKWRTSAKTLPPPLAIILNFCCCCNFICVAVAAPLWHGSLDA